ncbi:unnamed protein product [Polarella glacialis]|uniref:Uncharacterized protein n=1 Tax=Polarella glacialis TaxID=89957 RepID=A0A813GCH2_POLGL|nr:unnamed protein product [Polarella glacialis]
MVSTKPFGMEALAKLHVAIAPAKLTPGWIHERLRNLVSSTPLSNNLFFNVILFIFFCFFLLLHLILLLPLFICPQTLLSSNALHLFRVHVLMRILFNDLFSMLVNRRIHDLLDILVDGHLHFSPCNYRRAPPRPSECTLGSQLPSRHCEHSASVGPEQHIVAY